MQYTILIKKGDRFGYVAECPAIPGCVSQGMSLAQVRKNIREAVKACLEVMNEETRQRGRKTSTRIAQIAL